MNPGPAPAPDSRRKGGPPRSWRRWAWAPLAAAVLLADQGSKSLALALLKPGEPVPLVGRLFRANLVFNPGAAFGLRLGGNWHLVIFALLLSAFLVWSVRGFAPGALGLLLGGAAGNLVDRVRFGQVVDFLDLRVWPVFNVADVAITLGAVWLALNLWSPPRHRPAGEAARGG